VKRGLIFVVLLCVVTALADWTATALQWVMAWAVLSLLILLALLRIERHRRTS
jgi:hypothetical protein